MGAERSEGLRCSSYQYFLCSSLRHYRHCYGKRNHEYANDHDHHGTRQGDQEQNEYGSEQKANCEAYRNNVGNDPKAGMRVDVYFEMLVLAVFFLNLKELLI
jgi:hypothetical protein